MRPLCDIVLLTWNRADLLKACLQRILQHTDVPSRLLVVDNASTDPEAVQCLRQLQTADGTPFVQLEVVRRTNNDGFAKGINDGLRRTNAAWICLLNNDTLVTDGWLSEMIRVMEANPRLGLLNPMSNEFGRSLQKGETVDDAARRLKARSGRWLENWSCVGFCWLMPQKILQQVGPLPEEYQPIYFEDADYSLRVRRANLDCGIALGSYVHHLGGATMNRNPEKEKIFKENEQRFYRRWGLVPSQRIAWLLPPGQGSSASDGLTEKIRRMANEDHQITAFCTAATRRLVPEHYRVSPVVLPALLFQPMAFARIAAKRKPFHRIIRSGNLI